VQFGTVTFMLTETILWKLCAEVTHDSVARDFRDHAGGGDALAEAITIDNRSLGNRKRDNRQAVDQDVLGRREEHFNGNTHRAMRRPQNIDAINLDRVHHANAPANVDVARELSTNFLAEVRRQLLRIIEFTMAKFLRKNNRGRDNRPGQRAAPRFVDAPDAGNADRAQFFFMPKSAAPIHHRKILKY
jgi:hypothetical protein